MDYKELNQVIQESLKESSNVEIRLFDTKNNRILYKTLTNCELTGVLESLKDIKWKSLKGEK